MATAEQIAEIVKALGPLAGDDAGKQALLVKALGSLVDDPTPVVKNEDPVTDANPLNDVLTDLYKAVTTIQKANGTPADVSEAFEKAFDVLTGLYQEVGEAGFGAGADSILKSKQFKKMKKLAKRAKAGKRDNTTGGDGRDHTDNEDQDPDETRPDCIDDDKDEYMAKVMKSGGPIASFLAELKKQNDTLQTQVNTLVDEKQTALFQKTAADIGENAQFADLLKSLAKVDPKLSTQVANFAKGKNAVIAKSGMFAEIGGGGSPDSSGPTQQLNAKATEIQKASNGKITFAKSFLQACEQNPEIYAEYKRETYGR